MSAPALGWQHFPHQADVGLTGFGPTIEAAYEQAALALTAAITDPESVQTLRDVEISCQAPDRELLLVEWLNALIYEMATRDMLFGRYKVRIDGNRLHATASGETVSRERHQPAVEVKGATYTALAVRQDEDGRWTAACVIDV